MFDKFMGYVGKMLMAVLSIVLLSAFMGSLFWIAWNSVAQSLFHLPPLTFLQSWAIHYIVNDFMTTIKPKEATIST